MSSVKGDGGGLIFVLSLHPQQTRKDFMNKVGEQGWVVQNSLQVSGQKEMTLVLGQATCVCTVLFEGSDDVALAGSEALG